MDIMSNTVIMIDIAHKKRVFMSVIVIMRDIIPNKNKGFMSDIFMDEREKTGKINF